MYVCSVLLVYLTPNKVPSVRTQSVLVKVFPCLSTS